VRAARVDANQAEIVAVLRAHGATVQHLHTVGKGCPDLLVGWRGVTSLIEVKSGPKAQLEPDQLTWHRSWQGGPLSVVYDVEGAMRVLKLIDKVCHVTN
jgi:hypothetical protein